ncbi:DUF1275 domain-containing protein [Clostridium chromiireducens]|uniref:DUF1275 domain-containing protein n=1 Tax=Clostridium chromiireducens TaxID=225345 RepID=A0A964W090_9CLOT|nr:YoaK family protein [Clostridium chromiireducens]MVX62199.1 DUF1275 domain-containing protein [Clostridium chromiireducens]
MITKDINNSAPQKTQIYTKTSESVQLGFLLAIVGGFLDAYTFICRGEVFANAQTGNIVLVGIELTKGDFVQALTAFFPILAFIIGVLVAERLRDVNFSSPSFITGAERIILIIEIIVLIIIGFIPNTVPHIFTTVPISFVSSVQISCFRKLVDSPYCTTMCTGNLRSACQSAYIAFTRKDKKSITTTIRYGIIIFSFLAGACIGGMLTLQVGVKSIWFAALILIFSLCLYIIDERRFSNNTSVN